MLGRGLAALLALVAHGAVASCPPSGSTRDALLELKRHEWKVDDDASRQELALALLDCLSSPDPVLRDDVAFDALQHWARAKSLTPATLQSIRTSLMPRLAPRGADGAGFTQPFAALALAEVARVDRLQPFLTSDERAALVAGAASYLAGVRDYRGYDEREGWRHGVAHGADLALQLVLHPALERTQLDALLAAIASQVMPAGHFYLYGEGDRLMAPVFYAGRRDAMSTAEWSTWFSNLAAQRRKSEPATQATLAANHDLSAFLLPLYASLRESGTAEMQARMLPGVAAAIKTLD